MGMKTNLDGRVWVRVVIQWELSENSEDSISITFSFFICQA